MFSYILIEMLIKSFKESLILAPFALASRMACTRTTVCVNFVNFSSIRAAWHKDYSFKVIPLYCIAHPYRAVYHAQLARAHKENGGFL